jgi:hypothetical protein
LNSSRTNDDISQSCTATYFLLSVQLVSRTSTVFEQRVSRVGFSKRSIRPSTQCITSPGFHHSSTLLLRKKAGVAANILILLLSAVRLLVTRDCPNGCSSICPPFWPSACRSAAKYDGAAESRPGNGNSDTGVHLNIDMPCEWEVTLTRLC